MKAVIVHAVNASSAVREQLMAQPAVWKEIGSPAVAGANALLPAAAAALAFLLAATIVFAAFLYLLKTRILSGGPTL